MTSLLTNASAMTALQTLSATNRNLETTQGRIATGLKVATAADNAAYWSIATTMRSDNKALSAVTDALGLGAATIDVAYTALESTIEVVDEIKSKLVAAREPGVDREKIQSEIGELQKQLTSIADSAVFNGENWLSTNSDTTENPLYNATKTIVGSFSRAGGTVSIQTIEVDLTSITLYDPAGDGSDVTTAAGILDTTTNYADNTGAGGTYAGGDFSITTLDISLISDHADDLTSLEAMITAVDGVMSSLADAAGGLGAIKTRVDLQQDFVSNLMDAIDRGIGQLVDADMNEESTRLQALQVQQQLGIQALSIANSNGQNVLSLFR